MTANIVESFTFKGLAKVGTTPEQDVRFRVFNGFGTPLNNALTDVNGETPDLDLLTRNLSVTTTPPPSVTDFNPYRFKALKWSYNFEQVDIEVTAPGETTAFLTLDPNITESVQATVDAYTGVSIISNTFIELGKPLSGTPVDNMDRLYDYFASYWTKSANANYDSPAPFVTPDKQNYQYYVQVALSPGPAVAAWDFDLQGRSLAKGAVGPNFVVSGENVRFTNGTLDNLDLDTVWVVDQLNLDITGTLNFRDVGTYNITGCTINEVVNNSGGAVTLNLINSSVAVNTGPNITINQSAPINITCIDTVTKLPIQGVNIILGTGPGLSDVVDNVLTDVNGQISESYSGATPDAIEGFAAKGTETPTYKRTPISGNVETGTGFTTTVEMTSDD